jgi:dTDP-4-dehydrorhamnose reductase
MFLMVKATEPYQESSVLNPTNVYGQSKLKGEEEALNGNKDVIIIRTAWVYSPYGNNFVKTMLRLMNSKAGNKCSGRSVWITNLCI